MWLGAVRETIRRRRRIDSISQVSTPARFLINPTFTGSLDDRIRLATFFVYQFIQRYPDIEIEFRELTTFYTPITHISPLTVKIVTRMDRPIIALLTEVTIPGELVWAECENAIRWEATQEQNDGADFGVRYAVTRLTGVGLGLLPIYPINREAAKTAERSIALLKEWLSPSQLEQFNRDGTFDVIGGDTSNRYRICKPEPYNILHINPDGAIQCRWCVVPRGATAPGDVMLAQKIGLEKNEIETLRVANRPPLMPVITITNPSETPRTVTVTADIAAYGRVG
jgi:hypothetical protein